jgi:hypothetical protein
MTRKVVIPVSMDTEADRDLLRWLERQENRSAAIRDALREYIGRGSVTLGDVYQAVKELERKLQAGAAIAGSGGDEWEEPPEAAAALDALASL